MHIMLRSHTRAISSASSRRLALQVSSISRSFSRSAAVCLEENVMNDRDIAKELEKRRVAYSKQVSKLRKQYAAEVARQRAADEAAAEAEKRESTRRTLEYARRKNIRSALNALKQQQIKARQDAEFAEELRLAQMVRDAKKARFAKARQMVVNELEEVAHLWLMTPEEVENAFTLETEQLLWARPNSVLGEENPSLDTEFWRYESHTWHMDKTYPTPRELLLQELLDQAYEEANVDESFWTPERLEEREALERKARLRAMVLDMGRRILLKKQQELLQDEFSNRDKTQIPKPIPVPSLSVLANTKAMEKEGVSVLLKDPTKFFEFEAEQEHGDESQDDVDSPSTYQGPSLGAPVALKNESAFGPHEKRAYPQPVGKMLKPDTRSERQKRRAEREERMWAAAQEASDQDKLVSAVEATVEKKFGGSDIDYANPPDYDSDDEEWEKGLDPELDADILSTPRDKRYKEEDITWVKAELEKKSKQEKDLLRLELSNAVHESRYKQDNEVVDIEDAEEVKDVEDEDADLRSLGIDVDQLNSILESLSEEQMLSLLTEEELESDNLSSDEISEKLKAVPGLTDEQIEQIVQLEQSLASNENVRRAYGKEEDS